MREKGLKTNFKDGGKTKIKLNRIEDYREETEDSEIEGADAIAIKKEFETFSDTVENYNKFIQEP